MTKVVKLTAKTRKRETNEQVIRRLMNFCPTGALSQMFIMDALSKHADAVSKATPEQIGTNGFIHPQAWIATAQYIKEELDRHMDPRN